MTLRLKENLLIEILAPTNSTSKYSKGLLNLKTIVKLEDREEFKLPNDINELYNKLLTREEDFINKIPLSIIEKYFNQKIDNLNSFINIQFKERELNIKTNELFIELEGFYNEIFLVASLIASYYNLEVKVGNNKNDSDFI
jgi:hypothetical protein